MCSEIKEKWPNPLFRTLSSCIHCLDYYSPYNICNVLLWLGRGLSHRQHLKAALKTGIVRNLRIDYIINMSICTSCFCPPKSCSQFAWESFLVIFVVVCSNLCRICESVYVTCVVHYIYVVDPIFGLALLTSRLQNWDARFLLGQLMQFLWLKKQTKEWEEMLGCGLNLLKMEDVFF